MDEGPLPALALPSDCAHLAGEEGVALRGRPLSLGQHEQQLSKDAREGPHVDSRRVALQQDELGRAVPGTCARAHHGAHAQLCEGGGYARGRARGRARGAAQGARAAERYQRVTTCVVIWRVTLGHELAPISEGVRCSPRAGGARVRSCERARGGALSGGRRLWEGRGCGSCGAREARPCAPAPSSPPR